MKSTFIENIFGNVTVFANLDLLFTAMSKDLWIEDHNQLIIGSVNIKERVEVLLLK